MSNRIDKRVWGVLGKQQTFFSPQKQVEGKVKTPLNANAFDSWDVKRSRFKRVDGYENAIQQGGVVPQPSSTPVLSPTPTPSITATATLTPTPTTTPTNTPTQTSTSTPTPSPSAAPGYTTSGLTLYVDANNSSSYVSGDTIWYDLTTNNNDLYLTGTTLPIFATDGSIKCFNVNSGLTTSSYFYANNDVSLQFTTGMTFEFWVYMPASGGYKTFLNKQDPNTWSPPYGNYCWRISSLAQHEWWANSYFNRGTYSYNITGAWKQVVLTWDTTGSGNYSFYENGVFIANGGNSTTPCGTSIYPLLVGQNLGLEQFKGNMSIIRLYNRRLTSTEITTNFNYDKSIFGL